MREAFGPVIDRLAANGIDLTKMPVEVAPIAHYHMGGVACRCAHGDATSRACWPPAKRSAAPTAPTGSPATRSPKRWCSARRAGRSAAARAARMRAQPFRRGRRRRARSLVQADGAPDSPIRPRMLGRLQAMMADDVGPFRTEAGLKRAIARYRRLDARTRRAPVRRGGAVRHVPDRLVRPAQHAAGGAERGAGGAAPHRKPRRPSARGFSRPAAAMACQPGGAVE